MTQDAARPAAPDPRSIQQLVEDAVTDARVLVEQQRALARAELTHSAVRAAVAAGLVVTAVTLLWFSMIALLVAIAEGFVGAGLPRWGAYLLTFGIYVIVAVVLAGAGALVARRIGPPRKAMALARETVAEVRARVRHLGRSQPTEHPPGSTAAAPSTPSTPPGSSAVSAS
jgi:hypothetical protein